MDQAQNFQQSCSPFRGLGKARDKTPQAALLLITEQNDYQKTIVLTYFIVQKSIC